MGGTYGLRQSIERSGAVREGHFPSFASGRHGLQKIEFDIALADGAAYQEIAQAIGLFTTHLAFDAYVGIKTQGEQIADMVGVYHPEKTRFRMNKNKDGSFVWETPEDAWIASRANSTLIVDDVLTKGTNIGRMANTVGRRKSQYLVVVQRSEPEGIADIPGQAILDWPLPDYAPEDCPGCKDRV